MKARVETGLERIARGFPRRFRRVALGLVAHQASVTRSLRHAVDVFRRHGSEVRAVFAPEHGVSGTEQDLVPVDHDRGGGTPVYSLYGAHLGPSPEMLEAIDLLVFDLQDVGSRYYTYISTMWHCMRACAAAGIEFVVLDRPNPIGGVQIEGNVVEPTHLSYVGIHPLAARHGMTTGEIARMMAAESGINVQLAVVSMKGWERSLWYGDCDLPWVLPSPNMPTLDTAVVYPGMCLLEGTNLSEGRGTTRPFEIFGAPWLDLPKMEAHLRACRLPGVTFRPLQFKPTFNKHGGEVCRGFQIHVLNRETFRPYATGVGILCGALSIHPAQFSWRRPPYEFETEKLPIDILLGSATIRLKIEEGVTLREIEASWREDERTFRRRRREFLLY